VDKLHAFGATKVKAGETAAFAKDTASDVADTAKDHASETGDVASAKAGEASSYVSEKASQAQEAAAETTESVGDATAETAAAAEDKASEAGDVASMKAGDAGSYVNESKSKAEDAVAETIQNVGENLFNDVAGEETLRMIEVYWEFAYTQAAIPVVVGRKSRLETFVGAAITYKNEVAGGEVAKFPVRVNAVPPRIASGSVP
jgi:hypothetical protein